AVVRQRDAVWRVHVERLGLVVAFAAGGGIAAVGDADPALEQAHGLAVEHVAHQAVALVHAQVRAIRRGDACRVLAAVLEHGQAVVEFRRDVLVGNDADDPAHVMYSRNPPAAPPSRAARSATTSRPATAPARPAIRASPAPAAWP